MQAVIVLPDSGGLVLPLAHAGFLVGLLVVERCMADSVVAYGNVASAVRSQAAAGMQDPAPTPRGTQDPTSTPRGMGREAWDGVEGVVPEGSAAAAADAVGSSSVADAVGSSSVADAVGSSSVADAAAATATAAAAAAAGRAAGVAPPYAIVPLVQHLFGAPELRMLRQSAGALALGIAMDLR
jgi:hypothetical protein